MTDSIPSDRRTVLKVAGGSTLLGGLGSVRAFKPARQDYTTLIEAGIRYSVPDGPSYERYHLDRLMEYRITPGNSQVMLRPSVGQETKDLFTSEETVANAGGITDLPASVTDQQPATELTTELTNRYQVDKYISLKEPIIEPRVTVEQAGDTTILRTEETNRELPADEKTTVTMESRTVTARTRIVTDEKADIPGVSEKALGYKVKRGTVQVEATPEVVVRNHGKLAIAEAIQ